MLFFQSFFGSELLCGLTPGAGSAVSQPPALLLSVLCAGSERSCGETPSKAIAVGADGKEGAQKVGQFPWVASPHSGNS